jgi:predicted protein tyrosine phosphatase
MSDIQKLIDSYQERNRMIDTQEEHYSKQLRLAKKEAKPNLSVIADMKLTIAILDTEASLNRTFIKQLESLNETK